MHTAAELIDIITAALGTAFVATARGGLLTVTVVGAEAWVTLVELLHDLRAGYAVTHLHTAKVIVEVL